MSWKCFFVCFSLSLQAKGNQAKINKWGYIKLKSLCTVKGTISKTNRQSTEWEEIFINKISPECLIFKIYKEITQLHLEKPDYKMSRGSAETFFQGWHTASRHMKRCLM